MKSCKTVLLVAGLVLCGIAVRADNTIYRNDFSMRESAQPIPAYGVVHEAQPYTLEKTLLCFLPEASTGFKGNDAAANARMSQRESYTYSAVAGTDRPNYDGWFTPYFIKASSTQNKMYPTLVKDGGDPSFTWFRNNTTVCAGVALHPIHNVFTNGLLKMQVDMYTPETWLDKTKLYYVRVFPVSEKYMDIRAWNGSNNTTDVPGRFGLRSASNSGDNYHNDSYFTTVYNSSSAQIGYSGRSNNGRKWVRFMMTYDLDNSTVTGLVYTLNASVEHPTFATNEKTSGTASTYWKGSTSCPIATAASGGVAGIGIDGYGSFHNASTTTNKVLVDNIRLSWKAPGATDFETFYENDFSNRWYKTICAANRGTTASYAPATATVADSSTVTMDYLWRPSQNTFATNNIVPALSSSPAAVQPIGFDGWRRLPYMDGNTAYCCNTASTGSQFDSGTGTNYLAFGSSKAFDPACGLVANRIGETYTSGKVHLSVDARIPAPVDPATAAGTCVSYIADALRTAVGLGSTALYSSPRASLAANLVAGCGYLRTVDGASTNHVPYVLSPASGATAEYAYETTYTEPTVPYLYRMEIVADLDTRTYDVSVTPLAEKGIDSSFMPTESPIFTKTGVAFASSATDIGTFYLYGFGSRPSAGVNYSTTVRVTFDNIRIWRQTTGAAAETLVYFNDFRTRTRTPSIAAGSIQRSVGYVADQYDIEDGQDNWVRRSVASAEGYWATATVRDDNGNQFLALGREMEAGQRVQVANTFGSAVTRPFRFSVDVRPPAAWRVVTGGMAIVSLGGIQMDQTQTAESDFNAHRQMAFGFCDVPGDSYCTWYRTGMQPVAYTVENGEESVVPLCGPSAIANDHWYRFKVKVSPAEGRYSVSLYDLGTTHPTINGSAGASLIGAVRDLPFLNDLEAGDGIAAFNIHANGMGGVLGEAGVDADNVLVDNIDVSTIPATTFVIR